MARIQVIIDFDEGDSFGQRLLNALAGYPDRGASEANFKVSDAEGLPDVFSSEDCNEAFKLGGKPIFCTQPHKHGGACIHKVGTEVIFLIPDEDWRDPGADVITPANECGSYFWRGGRYFTCAEGAAHFPATPHRNRNRIDK